MQPTQLDQLLVGGVLMSPLVAMNIDKITGTFTASVFSDRDMDRICCLHLCLPKRSHQHNERKRQRCPITNRAPRR
jgi:hypothetical protein